MSAHVALACVLWARGQPLKAEALLQAVTGGVFWIRLGSDFSFLTVFDLEDLGFEVA